MDKFISENNTEIIHKRTELMVKSKPEVLDIITSTKLNLSKHSLVAGKFGRTDCLPFSEVVPEIVNTMEGHPEKPYHSFIGLKKEYVVSNTAN